MLGGKWAGTEYAAGGMRTGYLGKIEQRARKVSHCNHRIPTGYTDPTSLHLELLRLPNKGNTKASNTPVNGKKASSCMEDAGVQSYDG